jgi:FkbH-like protein
MYTAERQRTQLKTKVGSLDEWLKTTETRVTIEALKPANLQRTAQLLNKTNQMNLTTRRMTEVELRRWAGEAKHTLWTIRVQDKFGDSGLTGIVSLSAEGKIGRIVDFILSCRVFGRKVEHAMLYKAIAHARASGLEAVHAEYLPTAKNQPCLNFFKNSGMAFIEEKNLFTWDVKKGYPPPGFLEIVES